MANNKIQLSDGTVLIDITSDTVDASHLMQGYTAHDKSGAAIVGTATGGGGDYTIYSGQSAPTGAQTGDIWIDTSEDEPIVAAATKAYMGMEQTNATSYGTNLISLTVEQAGTYKVSWMGARNYNSGTFGSQLYINNTGYGSAHTTFTNSYAQYCEETNVSLNVGDTVAVRARSSATNRYMMVGNLIIEKM